jgi:Uma2 family endonuclease
VNAPWEEFLEICDRPEYAKAKAYYFDYQLRIEDMGVGPDHAHDNSVILMVINLFCILTGLPVECLINASYRKPGYKEAQPDISYYIGDRAILTPKGSQIINLDEQPGPDLAIEIADSSLSDDLGKKRLLYEAIGIPEYWVIDVEQAEIIAFAIQTPSSQRIETSRVLPGLAFSVLQTALLHSRTQDQAQVGAWLMQQFQGMST